MVYNDHMFTGIVQKIAKVKNIKNEQGSLFLEIEKPFNFSVKSGSSIAVNGVCLTVCKVSKDSFAVEVMKATLDKTSFGMALPDWVNLEKSINAGDPIDGHFVLGHIDSVGIIEKIERDNRSMAVLISHPKDNVRFLVPRGSISVNGVSLTVAESVSGKFLINLVDYTIGGTIFRYSKEGDRVNIEYDILGKYLLNKNNG